MVLLIDANILLDVLLNRKEFARCSSLVWKLCETGCAKGYVSSLSFANMVYVMRKELTPEKTKELYSQLKLIFEFADLSSATLDRTAEMGWDDFEDAVQSAAAEQIHANFIITRNTKDFLKSKVMALTPSMFLRRVKAKQ